MDKKRIIAIIAFAAVAALMAFMVYWVFFRQAPTPTAPGVPTTPTTPGQFPSASTSTPTTGIPSTPGVLPTAPGGPGAGVSRPAAAREQEIVTDRSSNITLQGTSAKFYNEQDGRFYRVAKTGQLEQLNDQVFFNVSNVTWAPEKNESIIEYPDGSNIYYNFDTNEQVTLPKHWEEFSFSDTGAQIAAKSIGLSPENRWLVVSDPRGGDTQLVEPLGNNADKVIVDWSPNNQVVALSQTGEALGADRQELLFVGLHGENFLSTVVEGRGLVTQWSPTGDKLLYSVHSARSDFKPELWIVNGNGDAIGSGRTFLSLNTWADKCTFANERYIYCGVPRSLETGAGFAPTLADNTPDDITRIDLQTGLKTIIPTDEDHVIDQIFVSEDESTLYFSSKQRDGIFEASL